MGTVRIPFNVDSAMNLPGVGFPQYKQTGVNYSVSSYSFDATGIEGIQFVVPCLANYASGSITTRISWYADTAVAGDVVWGVQMSAITPNVYSTSMESGSFGMELFITGSHSGTNGERPHEHSIVLTGSALNSAVHGDYATFGLKRYGSTGNDTLAGDAQVFRFIVQYSDV